MSKTNNIDAIESDSSSVIGFKPIDTAPKDGTEVILRVVTRDGDCMAVEILNGWFDTSWRRVCHTSNCYQYFSRGEITHWMPIPDIDGV